MTTPDRTILSANLYPGWSDIVPKLVVIHSTRSGRSDADWTDDKEMAATLSWFLTSASNASAHWVVSATEKVRVVLDTDRSWHAKEFSHVAYGIELTQPLRSTPYTEGHYRNLVEVCRDYVAMGVPVRHLPRISQQVGKGFTGHEETAQGVRDGKSDPGPVFDWDKFIAMLTPQEDEMRLIRTPGGYVHLEGEGTRQYVPNMVRVQAFIAAGRLSATVTNVDAFYAAALKDLGPVGEPLPGGSHTKHTVTAS
jgi:hypothetical protein